VLTIFLLSKKKMSFTVVQFSLPRGACDFYLVKCCIIDITFTVQMLQPSREKETCQGCVQISELKAAYYWHLININEYCYNFNCFETCMLLVNLQIICSGVLCWSSGTANPYMVWLKITIIVVQNIIHILMFLFHTP